MTNIIWAIRKFGLRRLIRYERARRKGTTIDYTKVFTPEEIQTLSKAGLLPDDDKGRQDD